MGRIGGIVIVTAILAAIAPGMVGGHHAAPLRWNGAPRMTTMAGTVGDRLLFGHVVNRSDRRVRLRAADVHVLDADGEKLHTSAAFADGFVAGVTLRGYDSDLYGADEGAAAVGREITLAPGAAAPLSVSFSAPGGERASAIEYGGGRLKLE
jgi:hypothetical protein